MSFNAVPLFTGPVSHHGNPQPPQSKEMREIEKCLLESGLA
jgi:hypothetical protein